MWAMFDRLRFEANSWLDTREELPLHSPCVDAVKSA